MVHESARLGDGVQVGPGALIGPEVTVGAGCEIGAHVVLDGHTTLGARNRIFTGAVVGSPPQDLKYGGGDCRLEIGDENTIREYATLNVATEPGQATRVGDRCLLMAYSHVAHNCVLGDHVILANSVNLAGHVEVGDHAIVGGMTPVHQFVVIGPHAFVGGGSRLSQDVPPFVKVAGNPICPVGINAVGLERRGWSAEDIARVKRCYRWIYRRGLRVEEARAAIRDEAEDVITAVFETFFERSRRGIVR
jgi:UDP-N-acetylglucosamine acyltransferase